METIAVIGINFAGWLHLFSTGKCKFVLRNIEGEPCYYEWDFPKHEHFDQWIDHFDVNTLEKTI
jgi:hypothetical protein